MENQNMENLALEISRDKTFSTKEIENVLESMSGDEVSELSDELDKMWFLDDFIEALWRGVFMLEMSGDLDDRQSKIVEVYNSLKPSKKEEKEFTTSVSISFDQNNKTSESMFAPWLLGAFWGVDKSLYEWNINSWWPHKNVGNYSYNWYNTNISPALEGLWISLWAKNNDSYSLDLNYEIDWFDDVVEGLLSKGFTNKDSIFLKGMRNLLWRSEIYVDFSIWEFTIRDIWDWMVLIKSKDSNAEFIMNRDSRTDEQIREYVINEYIELSIEKAISKLKKSDLTINYNKIRHSFPEFRDFSNEEIISIIERWENGNLKSFLSSLIKDSVTRRLSHNEIITPISDFKNSVIASALSSIYVVNSDNPDNNINSQQARIWLWLWFDILRNWLWNYDNTNLSMLPEESRKFALRMIWWFWNIYYDKERRKWTGYGWVFTPLNFEENFADILKLEEIWFDLWLENNRVYASSEGKLVESIYDDFWRYIWRQEVVENSDTQIERLREDGFFEQYSWILWVDISELETIYRETYSEAFKSLHWEENISETDYVMLKKVVKDFNKIIIRRFTPSEAVCRDISQYQAYIWAKMWIESFSSSLATNDSILHTRYYWVWENGKIFFMDYDRYGETPYDNIRQAHEYVQLQSDLWSAWNYSLMNDTSSWEDLWKKVVWYQTTSWLILERLINEWLSRDEIELSMLRWELFWQNKDNFEAVIWWWEATYKLNFESWLSVRLFFWNNSWAVIWEYNWGWISYEIISDNIVIKAWLTALSSKSPSWESVKKQAINVVAWYIDSIKTWQDSEVEYYAKSEASLTFDNFNEITWWIAPDLTLWFNYKKQNWLEIWAFAWFDTVTNNLSWSFGLSNVAIVWKYWASVVYNWELWSIPLSVNAWIVSWWMTQSTTTSAWIEAEVYPWIQAYANIKNTSYDNKKIWWNTIWSSEYWINYNITDDTNIKLFFQWKNGYTWDDSTLWFSINGRF